MRGFCRPSVGNQGSLMAKSHLRMKARKKTGTVMLRYDVKYKR